MAETAKEVQAFMEEIKNAETQINLAIGILSIIPGCGLLAKAIGDAIHSQVLWTKYRLLS